MYHEAKNQSMLGQIAVGQVVMNRVEDSRFPDNVCDVVTQSVTYKGTDKPVCISVSLVGIAMVKKMNLTLIVKNGGMQEYASIVLSGTIMLDVTEGDTHYPATYVRPAWRKQRLKLHE